MSYEVMRVLSLMGMIFTALGIAFVSGILLLIIRENLKK